MTTDTNSTRAPSSGTGQRILCYIPPELAPSQKEGAAPAGAFPAGALVRSALKRALSLQLTPASIPPGATRLAVLIDHADVLAVQSWAKKQGLAPGRIIGGLIQALIQTGGLQDLLPAGARVSDALDTYSASNISGAVGHEQQVAQTVSNPALATNALINGLITGGLRPGQVRTLSEAAPLLKQGRLVFAECGTGSGKARLLNYAAAYILGLRDSAHLPDVPTMREACRRSHADDTPVPDFLVSGIERARQRRQDRIAHMEGSGSQASSDDGRTTDAAKPCVIMCAPSIENVMHLVREWQRCADILDPQGLRRLAVRLGRSQFVCQTALEQSLEHVTQEFGHIEGVNAGVSMITRWLEQDMPSGQCPATQSLANLQKSRGVNEQGEQSRYQAQAIGGLMADLEHLVQQSGLPDLVQFDHKSLSLDENDDDHDARHYNAHKAQAAHGCDILYTTHATLALDNLQIGRENGAPLLPPNVAAVLIDEAHLFESAQSNAAASSFSVHRILAELGNASLEKALSKSKGATPGASIPRARALAKQVNVILGRLPEDALVPIPANRSGALHWAHARLSLAELGTTLEAIAQAASKGIESSSKAKKTGAVNLANLSEYRQVRNIIRHFKSLTPLLERLANGDASVRGILQASPSRAMMSIQLGASSVAKPLLARWSVTPAALMVSGTLAAITKSGSDARHSAHQLSALSRFAQVTPLMPSWLYTQVQVMQPHPDCAAALTPPSTSRYIRAAHAAARDSLSTRPASAIQPSQEAADEDQAAPEEIDAITQDLHLQLKAWLSNVAQALSVAAEQAKGGTLVLSTSHDRSGLLQHIILESECLAHLRPRLIIHREGRTLSSATAEFIAKAKAGDRPIWVSTGAAWTGLDLADKSLTDQQASDDLILTDLIIPALPFGLERSTTHLMRSQRMGFGVEVEAAQKLFRQGIGRLIRREGVQHRKLWILDGRLISSTAPSYVAEFKRVLLPYVNKKPFLI